jgi:hypothetical protein
VKKKKMKKSMLILTTAFVCLVICSFPVFGQTTYVETLDIYEYSVGPSSITWSHTYDNTADPVATATLTIVADDVDGAGNSMNGEQDEVYINEHYLGLLNDMGYYTDWEYYPGPGNPGHPDALTTTTFTIDPTWLDSTMPVEVVVEPSWGVEIETSTLTVVNNPPVANAGPDQTNVEQDSLGGASVTLNGAGSYDPDGHPLTYSWTWPPSGLATGVSPIVLLPLGTTTITLTVSDGGLTDTDTVDITVVDTTPPVITLLGANPQTIECGDAYTELWATAMDVCCGDLTANIVIDANAVDTSTVGSYTVTYDVTDCNNNPAAQVTRVVNVEDNTPPVISLLGADPQTIECGDAYTELWATAMDVCCGDLTANIVIDASAVDTSMVGSYTVTYDVIDCNGNPAAQVTRVVNVEDNTPPDISVTVSPDTLWPPNHKMVDITATVTVSDICDADPTVVLTSITSDEPDNAIGIGDGNTINDIQLGTDDRAFQLRAERAGTGDGRVYTITYTATDASDNSAFAIATVVVPHDMD